MIAIAKKEAESRDDCLQAKFVTMMPVIIRNARVAFRKLTPEAKQEAIQEVIASSWVTFKSLAERGRLDAAYATPLAVFGIKQARSGRKVGGHLNCRDVSSRFAQLRKKFRLGRLDQFDQQTGEWREVLVEDVRSGPAETAAARLDFAAWLHRLPARLREVAETLAAGESTKEAAQRFGITQGRVSQHRSWLRRNWLAFQGEAEIEERLRLAVA